MIGRESDVAQFFAPLVARAKAVSNRGRTCCHRCHGYGTYFWGAVVNGIPSHSGPCFRCGGSGVDPRQKRRGSIAHERQAARFAQRGELS